MSTAASGVPTVVTASCSKNAAGTSRKFPSSNVDHEAVFSLEYDSPAAASRVARAIEPELGGIDDDRSSVHSEQAGDELRVTVFAADPVALRAATNTWLSLIRVAEQAGDVS